MKFENEPLGNFEMSPEKRMFYIFYYWYRKNKKEKNWFSKKIIMWWLQYIPTQHLFSYLTNKISWYWNEEILKRFPTYRFLLEKFKDDKFYYKWLEWKLDVLRINIRCWVAI